MLIGCGILERYRSYGGCEIADDEIHGLHYRATEQLALYEQTYTVTELVEDGHECAVYAMMEVLHRHRQAVEAPQSVTVGSVSTTNRAVDTSPEALSKALYRAASRYLSLYRGVG